MAGGVEGWARRTASQPVRAIVQNICAAVEGGATSWIAAMRFVRIV